MQTPPRPTTGMQGGNEIPKTDKLSSGQARSNNPHKRGSEFDEKNSGVSFINNFREMRQSGIYIASSIGFLYSMAYFIGP